MKQQLLSFAIGWPFLGALTLLLVSPEGKTKRVGWARTTALVFSVLSALCSLICVASMHPQQPELQFAVQVPWIGSYAINYHVGLDGLNMVAVLLLSILFPVVLAAEWKERKGSRGLLGLILLLQGALLGAVLAQDLFLQLFFWSMSVFPFYFLIGIWGGERREEAAFSTLISATLGNALLFLAILLAYYAVDPHTFSLHELAAGKLEGKSFSVLGMELPVASCVFWLLFVGLCLRIPIWPLQGWFSLAATQASPSVFVCLAGGAVPVGTYLLIRLSYTLLPQTLLGASPWVVGVGLVNLVVGMFSAIAQKNLKSLLASLALAEVGLILLGVGSVSNPGLVGALYQQLTMGLALAGFGLFTGWIDERVGHTDFVSNEGERALGGVAVRAPMVAILSGLWVASLLGLPGMGGFVGHSLLLVGTYSAYPIGAMIATGSMALGVYGLFSMYRLVFLGRSAQSLGTVEDLSTMEKLYSLPLLAGVLVFGLYPKPFIDLIRPTVVTLLSTVR